MLSSSPAFRVKEGGPFLARECTPLTSPQPAAQDRSSMLKQGHRGKRPGTRRGHGKCVYNPRCRHLASRRNALTEVSKKSLLQVGSLHIRFRSPGRRQVACPWREKALVRQKRGRSGGGPAGPRAGTVGDKWGTYIIRCARVRALQMERVGFALHHHPLFQQVE